MPVIQVVSGATASMGAKSKLMEDIVAMFSEEVKIPKGHVHVWILDGQTFGFGGDVATPGVYVTVKSSALQLLPEHRKSLITALVPALQACFPGLLTDRVTTMFEELPVENIAIGTYISIFGRRSTSSRPVDWDTEGPSPH